MIRRTLICERCGREQEVCGRVIEEAERALSYRWCRNCLDNHGPCAKPAGTGEAAGIGGFFGGLAEHLKAEIKGQQARTQFAVGDLVVYCGSHADKRGPAEVLEDLGRTVLVRTRGGTVECNWTSLQAAPQGLLDAAAAQREAKVTDPAPTPAVTKPYEVPAFEPSTPDLLDLYPEPARVIVLEPPLSVCS